MGILECVVYVFLPTLLGWLFNLCAMYGGAAFGLVYYLMPAVVLFGWFWVGKRFARRMKNPVLAVLAGNSIGFLSLAVYLWQEYLAAEKINWLQQLSQYFSSPLMLLNTRILMPFSAQVDGVAQISNTAIQVVGLILMLLPFIGGFFMEKQKRKLEK